MTKRLTAIVYNTISHGHWNEPAHGFNVSFSANGTPLIPQIGKPQWITGGRYIHYLAHRGIRTCRLRRLIIHGKNVEHSLHSV